MQSNIEEKSEQRRTRTLQIQKKTFTNYINSVLVKAHMKVDDLFVDLCSGVILIRLLELVSGQQLPPPCRGNMRAHHMDNINKCLQFLYSLKVHVESIGAAAIVDGNPHLTLGLVWTIILRFHIQGGKQKSEHSSEKALLLWCQRKTRSYEDVTISNFSDSWSNGLAFNALIHSQGGELFDFPDLLERSDLDNLNHAFKIAEETFNIPRLLDAEDVDAGLQDEKSTIAYVASYYHTFERLAKQRGNNEGQLSQRDEGVNNKSQRREKEHQLYKEQINQQRQEAENLELLNLQREEELRQQQLKKPQRQKLTVLFFCIFLLFLSMYIIKDGYISTARSLAWL